MIQFGRPSRPLPAERLQGLVSVGTPVRIKVGFYKGRYGIVAEALTTNKQPAFCTGAMRYAIRFSDNRLLDFLRHEFAKAPKERR